MHDAAVRTWFLDSITPPQMWPFPNCRSVSSSLEFLTETINGICRLTEAVPMNGTNSSSAGDSSSLALVKLNNNAIRRSFFKYFMPAMFGNQFLNKDWHQKPIAAYFSDFFPQKLIRILSLSDKLPFTFSWIFDYQLLCRHYIVT